MLTSKAVKYSIMYENGRRVTQKTNLICDKDAKYNGSNQRLPPLVRRNQETLFL